jgi:acetyltransferase
MWQRKQWLDASQEIEPASSVAGYDMQAAHEVIEASLSVVRDRIENVGMTADEAYWMPPDEVARLLHLYDIRTPASGLAKNAEEAITLAASIGYPVALKLVAPGVTHKMDVGGVALNIDDADALKSAIETMQARIGHDRMEGVYVQQMIQAQAEVIVGTVRDPQFGPLAMVGSGGTLVELMGDVAFELAPLTRYQANAMLDRTATGRLLSGYRGQHPADREAVIDVLLRLAQITQDWSAIEEIEINPLMVMPAGRGAYAIDVRVRLHEPDA